MTTIELEEYQAAPFLRNSQQDRNIRLHVAPNDVAAVITNKDISWPLRGKEAIRLRNALRKAGVPSAEAYYEVRLYSGGRALLEGNGKNYLTDYFHHEEKLQDDGDFTVYVVAPEQEMIEAGLGDLVGTRELNQMTHMAPVPVM